MAVRRDDFGWTHTQRLVITVLLVGLLCYASYRIVRDRASIADPLPSRSPLETRLADRIDPDSADVPTLAALPGLGENRAAEIVGYRERVRGSDPSRRIFNRAEDLMQVRGIGGAMVAQLSPYLAFPDATATTRPTTARPD